jgi:dihydroorotate dehydrogenase
MLNSNLFPKANINNKVDMSNDFLGYKFKHPVGLGPGIDITGKCVNNLNDLGFEYIEVGPFVDQSEEDNSPDITISDTDKSVYFKKQENLYSYIFSLSILQNSIRERLLQNKHSLVTSANLKISNKSGNSIPYMCDSMFKNMVKSAFHVSDFITLNFSAYDTKAILQYKNLSKFESLLAKIKNEIYYEMGIKASMNYELTNPVKEGEMGLFDMLKIQFPYSFVKLSRPKLMIRFDTKITNEEIKNYVEICRKSEIVDGIVIGGMVKDKLNLQNAFVSGEKSREESLKLLKEAYNITKGEIPLVSTGGILTGEDVYERISNGADMVLIYTHFIFNGPYCLERILNELEEKMNKEGKASIKEIINNRKK